METILTIAVVMLVAVSAVFVVRRYRKVHSRNRAIAESLDVIRLSAENSRIKGIVAEVDVAPAFEKLRELAEACPRDVAQSLKDMEDRWQEIQRRVGEFNSQDTFSTLQSSVTMVKTDKLVDEIHDLARGIEKGLGDRSS